MIFDNLTFVALALVALISVFLISTKNRSRCKDCKPCLDSTEKRTEK
ncbi:hypothetical protein [Sedimenticola sp.]